MSEPDEPMQPERKRRLVLNPGPLGVIKLPRCRKCGRLWGMRGDCECLVGDPAWPDDKDAS